MFGEISSIRKNKYIVSERGITRVWEFGITDGSHFKTIGEYNLKVKVTVFS